MPNSKLNKDIPLINDHWAEFIHQAQNDMLELSTAKESMENNVKSLRRILEILASGKEDIGFLIMHKESLIRYDRSLARQLEILEAFKNRDNLDNDIAVDLGKSIVEKGAEVSNRIKELEEQINQTAESIASIEDQISMTQLDPKIIIGLCKKFNFDVPKTKNILLFPIIKTLSKSKSLKPDQEEIKRADEELQNMAQKPEEERVQPEETKSNVTSRPASEEDSIEYLERYQSAVDRYEQLKQSNAQILNKYFGIIQEMPKYEFNCYKACLVISISDIEKEIEEQLGIDYPNAAAKLCAIKAMDQKKEIEDFIQSMQFNGYDNDDLEYLEEAISEFEKFCNKLSMLDADIVNNREQELPLEDTKVYFLLNEHGQPAIPSDICEGSLQGKLANIIERERSHSISQKRGRIMPLEIKDPQFEKKLDRTVLSVRNSKLMVSYVKINSDTGLSNDGGLFILTAEELVKGTDGIQYATDRVIKDYGEQILEQISLTESKNQEFLARQATLREQIVSVKESDSIGGGAGLNGLR